jgi:hypothetical protein
MTNIELAEGIRHNLFADRKTVKKAWDETFEMIERLPWAHQAGATTAIMVLMNTISNQILENEKVKQDV